SALQKIISASSLPTLVGPLFASMIGTIIALFPSNPNNMTLPSRDSGVFLYVGWRFLNGDIPYRDVWDHKPPLIYFVDALGITLTPDSLWGVWLLQILFIFFTLLFVYKLLDREFGIYAALAGTITLTSGLLTILEKGNVTEEYALVFQTLCLWLFISAWKNDFPVHSSFWIGLFGGLAFNFKQTTIGIWITYALFLLAIRFLQRKAPFKDLLSLLAGWLIPSVVLIIYLASQNAFIDYWEQAFLYNFVYIGKHEGIRRLIPVFIKGFAYLQNGWVLYLSLLGWLAGFAYVWVKRRHLFTEAHPLVLIALVNLPIEILLITISGRSILHYYLTPLPAMAILAGTLVYTVPFLVGKIQRSDSQKIQRWAPGIVLAAVLLGQFGQVTYYPDYVRILRDNDYAAVIDYLAKNTEEGDQLLLIGAESVVNFLARREAPTRYVYQYPLALLGRRPMFEEYFNQILENKPVFIIDTRGRTRLDEKLYTPMQKRSQIVRDGVQYLGTNYQQAAQFDEWFVYRLVE
ncbi:MAG TPA: glycosyltransferase family 39 protein, partial [Anaerolineales bacterium]|nr:glycosyltransferase family 39 protein [Anaerolineales bacterium]